MTDTVSTRELARNTRNVVDRLDAGEALTLTRRDKVVAHLIPVQRRAGEDVPPPKNPRGLRDWRPPAGTISTCGSDALAALREDER